MEIAYLYIASIARVYRTRLMTMIIINKWIFVCSSTVYTTETQRSGDEKRKINKWKHVLHTKLFIFYVVRVSSGLCCVFARNLRIPPHVSMCVQLSLALEPEVIIKT